MSDDGAGGGLNYVTYREHITAKEEAAKRMASLELEQAAMKAALMHLPDEVRQLTAAVNALPAKMAPQQAQSDSTLLMMHRLLDQRANAAGGGMGLIEKLVVWGLLAIGGAVASHLLGWN